MQTININNLFYTHNIEIFYPLKTDKYFPLYITYLFNI